MKIERGSRVLVDTNVLLEATDTGRRLHERAMAVFREWPAAGVDLFVGTQVLREYLVVATRPVTNNGLGMSLDGALDNIGRFRCRVSVVAETRRAGELFLEWAARYGTKGKKLHDLQLLATASAAGLDALLTANQNDFPKPPPLQILPLAETAG